MSKFDPVDIGSNQLLPKTGNMSGSVMVVKVTVVTGVRVTYEPHLWE